MNPNDPKVVLPALSEVLPRIRNRLAAAVVAGRRVVAADPQVRALALATHFQDIVVRQMQAEFPGQQDSDASSYLLTHGSLRLRFNKLGDGGLPRYNGTGTAEGYCQGFFFNAGNEGEDRPVIQVGWEFDDGLVETPVFRVMRIESGKTVWSVPVDVAVRTSIVLGSGTDYTGGPEVRGIADEAAESE